MTRTATAHHQLRSTCDLSWHCGCTSENMSNRTIALCVFYGPNPTMRSLDRVLMRFVYTGALLFLSSFGCAVRLSSRHWPFALCTIFAPWCEQAADILPCGVHPGVRDDLHLHGQARDPGRNHVESFERSQLKRNVLSRSCKDQHLLNSTPQCTPQDGARCGSGFHSRAFEWVSKCGFLFTCSLVMQLRFGRF